MDVRITDAEKKAPIPLSTDLGLLLIGKVCLVVCFYESGKYKQTCFQTSVNKISPLSYFFKLCFAHLDFYSNIIKYYSNQE
jgi:ABC-type uncharacterized transport system involved in gliding motility auxiliary subunit